MDITENIPKGTNLDDNIIQGKNSMRRNEYMGPCPPFGKHRYIFTIYALDKELKENPKLNKRKFLKESETHILDKTELLGYYKKN
jgi:Raf kinase inhibitor-like YbhB/YbcL family protein